MIPLTLLQDARANHYAIPAFNAVNLETCKAIVKGAELEQSPVILQISENAARYAGLKPLFLIAETLKEGSSIPIIIHFDHAETLNSALEAVELGFDSVMLQGANLGINENAKQLKKLGEIAIKKNVIVEGEFEIVSKQGREGESLNIDEFRDLAQASACDIIAIDIGSKHKMTQKEANLDLKRLQEIAQKLTHPLVLHGSSGVREKDLREAIKLGISKVNIATELMIEFTNGVRGSLSDEKVFDPREYLRAGEIIMIEKVRHYIRLLK